MRSFIHRVWARSNRLPWRAVLYGLAISSLAGQANAASPTLTPQPGVTAPASIPELARALKYDAKLIYEYVYTNIEYSPTFGAKKGAFGTLLDGYGNDFDQSALLVALLRQSGYTASYRFGKIRLNQTQLNSWLGTDSSNACNARNLLINGGNTQLSVATTTGTCAGTLVYVDIPHVWVAVTGGNLGATTYVLDPSYKSYTAPATGINLATATGYNQSSFLASAQSGATITSNSIQNLNRANIRANLTAYSQNLLAYINANKPTATMVDIIGGKLIQPLAQPYTLPTSLSIQTPGDVPLVWTGDVPSTYRTVFNIQIGSTGSPANINQTYYGDAVYEHRLSVVYNGSNQPALYLDGVMQGGVGAAGDNVISYAVTFPFCFGSTVTGGGCPTGSTNLFTAKNNVQAGSGYTYAIINGWDMVGRGTVEFHRQQLQLNQAAGNSSSSESVLGEALNMIGYGWLGQTTTMNSLTDQIIGSKNVLQTAIGVVGQAAGPYIDIPGGFAGVSSLSSDINRARTTFYSGAGHASALEWGNLDQNLDRASVNAVSTVKLLDIANEQSLIIYDATSANWPAIQPLLGGYSAGDMSNIANNYIAAGSRVILPQNGSITQNSWTGVGFLGISAAGNLVTYGISSNLKGGYPTVPVSPPTVVQQTLNTAPLNFSSNLPANAFSSFLNPTSVDPIALSSGAFLYDQEDISVGSAAFPYGLALHRSYSSGSVGRSGPFGKGWTHNFAVSVALNSDGFKGMGQDSPIDAVASIVEAYVSQDLLSDPAKPFNKLLVATLGQRWWMDQLINNSVNVTLGAGGEQFMLLPGGSYHAPLGSSDRLSLSSGLYYLWNKDGTRYSFNSDGNLGSWSTPDGMSVAYSYDAGTPAKLTSVGNGLGWSLSFCYDGSNRLSSVVRGSCGAPQRAVSYDYDAGGNLAGFTDTMGQRTAYGYASPSGSQLPGLLTQLFEPLQPSPLVTNAYDSLGRVMTQANGNNSGGFNTTWSYYFAGYRSEEDDPYSVQHVLYFNPRGRQLYDVQDAAGLNLVTRNALDGLDRLVTTAQPEGNSTSYTYAAANAWANNIASVTLSPKAAGPAPIVRQMSYDQLWNKVATLTDARGNVTESVYDPVTGALLGSTADAGAGRLNAMSKFVYDSYGRVTEATDPLGARTAFAFDGAGNLASRTADAGRLNLTTAYAYDPDGNLAAATNPAGNTTTFAYDPERRLLSQTAPLPFAAGTGMVQTRYGYNPAGQRVTVTRTNTPNDQITTTSYNATGKVASVTDPNGNTARSAYDRADRLESFTTSTGATTRYTYDALGRLATVTNALGQLIETHSYTPNGRELTFADALSTTRYGYDGFDRLTGTTYGYGTGLASSEALGYDPSGNINSRTTRLGDVIVLAYDGLNRLTTKTPPGPAPVVSYAYDLAGRLIGVSDSSTSIQKVTATSSYATSYSYDVLNRVTGSSWTPVAAAVTPTAASVTLTSTYSADNQRLGMSASDSTFLAYPSTTGTTNTTSNLLNQYTAVGTNSPTYDANGNLGFDGVLTYAYDAESRLTSVKQGATPLGSYVYDAQGRRKSATTSAGTTITVTDADNRAVLDYNGTTGQLISWYALGLGSNEVLARMDIASSQRTTYIPDMQGSTLALLGPTGTLTKTPYLPFGYSANTTPTYRYTGQKLDNETAGTSTQPGGLYYFRARTYSTATGRFLQPDPSGYSGGRNLYAYVGNDPVNLTDPSGLAPNGSSGTQYAGGLKDFYNSYLSQPVDDIRGLIENPSRIPGAISDVAQGVAPGLVTAPQAISRAIGVARILGAAPETSGNPLGIPDNFTSQPSQKGGGTVYVDPSNPAYNRVRLMPGNPNSPNQAQQQPYVIDMRNGQAIDLGGNPVATSDPAAHIPQNQYWYRP